MSKLRRGIRYKLTRWIYHALLHLAFEIGPPDRKRGGYWLYHEPERDFQKEPMLTDEEIKEERELADMGLEDYLASIERDEK